MKATNQIIESLRESIQRGDISKAAEIAGVHVNTVRNFLYGGNYNDRVYQAFIQIFEQRAENNHKALKVISET